MGWRIEKRFGGDAEVDVEVAGDHRSRIVVALSTDFRSECHLDEILLQSVFGVFQQYRSKAEIPTETLPQAPARAIAAAPERPASGNAM